MSKKEDIVVSICCQTYNHKNFIAQAIESFLMQKTNFKFEILLRDDASTDGTTDIAKEYSGMYPGIINPLFYSENQFQKGVRPFIDNAKRARGKYIAICEGDDYWTDPYKLQKQVDLLEAHPDITVCYHPVKIETYHFPTSKKYSPTFLRTKSGIFTFFDSLQGKSGATLSMMFRSDCLQNINMSIFNDLKMSDWPLECICTLLGNGYIHEDFMGVYRIHGDGITNTFVKVDFYDSRITFAKRLLDFNVTAAQKIFINEFIFRVLILKSIYLLENKYIFKAFKTLINSMFYIRLKRENNPYSWVENFSLKNATIRLLKKVKYKLFFA